MSGPLPEVLSNFQIEDVILIQLPSISAFSIAEGGLASLSSSAIGTACLHSTLVLHPANHLGSLLIFYMYL